MEVVALGVSMSMLVPDEVTEFPKMDSHFVEWSNEARDYSQVAVNPEYLARLAKLKSENKGIPLQFQTGPTANKPIRFRMGQYLEGAVMPVRIAA